MCMNQRIVQQTTDNKENIKFIKYYIRREEYEWRRRIRRKDNILSSKDDRSKENCAKAQGNRVGIYGNK